MRKRKPNHKKLIIEFHRTYFVMSLGFILTGHYLNLIIFTSLIIIHELGHYLVAKLNNFNVEKIITETKKACPNVNLIIEAVYPINKPMRFRNEKRSNKKINEMNNEFIKLCEKHGCTWLDLNDKLRDSKDELKEEFTFDGLHINAKAYEIIAQSVIPLLK